MDKKCSQCGGDMTMVCTDTHDHGQECKMQCANGHEEPMGSSDAPAEGDVQM